MTYNFQHFRRAHLIDDAVGTWQARGPQPGSAAPLFTLPDTEGEPWRLVEQRGRPVLLHFGSYT